MISDTAPQKVFDQMTKFLSTLAGKKMSPRFTALPGRQSKGAEVPDRIK